MNARVYPRVCGGTSTPLVILPAARGLSPRVRGNPAAAYPGHCGNGSIPACAGEPARPGTLRTLRWVYPRVCGGTPITVAIKRSPSGLSPRVRGNQNRHAGQPWGIRSIPACAGEPVLIRLRCGLLTVYPRVCGGTEVHTRHDPNAEGLSPRVRGNRQNGDGQRVRQGSIPACAGEPIDTS